MITFFPIPYFDELLWSVYARYADKVQYPVQVDINIDLSGRPNVNPNPYFPKGLKYLLETLPIGHNFTADWLINNHTVFPYFAPFLRVELANKLRNAMLDNSPSKPLSLAGAVQSQVQLPKFFKYCPVCVIEDRKLYGETYWHRVHQLIGVEVCPVHQVRLGSSKVPMFLHNATKFDRLTTAEKSLQNVRMRVQELSNVDYEILLKIAEDANWLLHHPDLVLGNHSFADRYVSVLAKKNLASRDLVVNQIALSQSVSAFYSGKVLAILNFKDLNPDWTRTVFQNRVSISPLCHLLLIQYLGFSISEMIEFEPKFEPFGNGTWPCLNPVCRHYKQPVIEGYDTEIKVGKRQERQIWGNFTCECGFTYSRKCESGKEGQKRFLRARHVITYGNLWETTFKELWSDAKMSVAKIARTFRMRDNSVIAHALRLGMVLPRVGSSLVKVPDELQIPKHSNRQSMDRAKRAKYREKVLRVLSDFPELSRKGVYDKCSGAYTWLRTHDLDWLEKYLPPKQKFGVKPPKDWERIDRELAEKIYSVAIELKSLDYPERMRVKRTKSGLVHITKSRMITAVNCQYLLKGHSDKLPLTRKALEDNTETLMEFVFRRIEYCAMSYKGNGIQPTRRRFIGDASLYPHLNNPDVIRVLDAALANLWAE